MNAGLVRAMTWNIWWRFGPRWTERQPGLVATIRRFDPDVLALQEVWGDQQRKRSAVMRRTPSRPIRRCPIPRGIPTTRV